jgi:hypothetical protein
VRGCGLDSCGSGKCPVSDPCEHGNEILSSIKADQLSLSKNYWCQTVQMKRH